MHTTVSAAKEPEIGGIERYEKVWWIIKSVYFKKSEIFSNLGSIDILFSNILIFQRTIKLNLNKINKLEKFKNSDFFSKFQSQITSLKNWIWKSGPRIVLNINENTHQNCQAIFLSHNKLVIQSSAANQTAFWVTTINVRILKRF